MLQFLSSCVEQQNAEHLIIDQPAEQLRNALQQLVDVKNGRQLARDFIQQNQGARLARGARVQTRILDSDRHARSNQREQPLVLFGEVVGLWRLDINNADEPILDDQRNRQLRAYVRNSGNVPRDLSQHRQPESLPGAGPRSQLRLRLP